MTRPQTFLPTPNVTTVIKQVQYLEHRMHILEEDYYTTQNLLELLAKFSVGGKRIHDANIVATMMVHGISHLLTHNVKDFEAFSSLITIHPLDNIA